MEEMEIMEAMKARHSVRQYTDKKIDPKIREQLNEAIEACNKESGLHMQAIYEEPKCFNSMMAHYGKFSGVTDYIVLVGKKGPKLEELTGYYGEKIVLLAQQLGLNSCWVAMTHGKTAAKVEKDEKIACVISIGYGENQGVAHKNKSLSEVSDEQQKQPEWFADGIQAVMLAPTASNQQKFYFSCDGKAVTAKAGSGFYAKMDLGIVKYHFEAVTGIKVG